ncbi:4Fe-4S binding protein [Rhodoferax sp.]|jgi:ferredoxin|uniref:4Fe-4S binding protein n=1 Tax=Rhodoferax sp. TaxID=50421 RepID=UPI00284AD2FA|nr:4Fe-4S binding protein [Rhodoferax sp.]MDR3369486.1 4Fe-4S binding protein [Rhodoferax sp.]
MVQKINTETCTSCDACQPECPNAAISVKKGLYVVNASLCTDCEGHFDEPQCVAVCPVDDCITEV